MLNGERKGKKFSVVTRSNRKKKVFKGSSHSKFQKHDQNLPTVQNVVSPCLIENEERLSKTLSTEPQADTSIEISASRRQIEQGQSISITSNVDSTEVATPTTMSTRSRLVNGHTERYVEDEGYRFVYLENIRKTVKAMHECKKVVFR